MSSNIFQFSNLHIFHNMKYLFFFFFFLFFISWRLITLQYCSGFCHTLTWISHGYTCIPHPDPSSHLPLHPIPLGLPTGYLPYPFVCWWASRLLPCPGYDKQCCDEHWGAGVNNFSSCAVSLKCFTRNTFSSCARSTLLHILNWLWFGFLTQLVE